MTFISNHITKVLGAVSTVLSTLMGLIASGQMEGLMSPESIRWLAIIGTLVGAAITGVGFNNSTKERVAQAMELAIKAQPPQEKSP